MRVTVCTLAGLAFAGQFFVCRILIGSYYGVAMLRAVLALRDPPVRTIPHTST